MIDKCGLLMHKIDDFLFLKFKMCKISLKNLLEVKHVICLNYRFVFDISETRLAPIITNVAVTSSELSVFWNHPSNDYDLVMQYEVQWSEINGSNNTSNRLGKTVKQFTVPNVLRPGQLYTVLVNSLGSLSNPSANFKIPSAQQTARLGMLELLTIIILRGFDPLL